ncbi:MAG TPA: trypsin-like peptidase domain-containing protein [Roseateles sp.]
MKPLALMAGLAAVAAGPALAADAALPLPEIYRATLPCLAQVYQVPTGEPRSDLLQELFGNKPARGDRKGDDGTMREKQPALPNGLGLAWGDGSTVLTAEFLVPKGEPEDLARHEFVLEAADGRRLEARLQALDRSSGIALLKATAPLGPACRFGNSTVLEVGQPVVAIGNMRRLRLLMFQGIVSALTDAGQDQAGQLAILTTTASGPGMAGGPLLDLQGRVIGMHQAMLVGERGAEGVSVALPIRQALAVADELVRHGKVQRSRLGVQAQDERLPLGKAALLQARRAPVVGTVLPGSPAERAGLRENDRLIAIDAVPLADTADLRRRVAAVRPGTVLRLELERDGARRSVSVTTDAGSED